jgi:outer membrane protein OmpA-like peptidoglycan-associated protein
MIRHTLLAAGLLAGTFALSVEARAQDQLTRNGIINSLVQTEATVARFDPMALQAEAERAAARGDAAGNATGTLTESLAKLPQISVEINFDRGSARILPRSYRAVGLIADALHTPYLMNSRFAVVGHTDATGSNEFNLKLSKERAKAVMRALATTFNVPPRQLVAIGLGEEALQDPANPDSAVNRRVQLINIGE